MNFLFLPKKRIPPKKHTVNFWVSYKSLSVYGDLWLNENEMEE